MDNMNLNKHISGQFNAELESVRNQVLVMGGLVEKQLTDAIAAIHGQDLDAARKIVANDHKVNAMEVAIDEECTRIIAKRQPTASDLRLVMAIIKTITDLERIGDVADKIARMLTDNANKPQPPLVSLENWGVAPSRCSTTCSTPSPAWIWMPPWRSTRKMTRWIGSTSPSSAS